MRVLKLFCHRLYIQNKRYFLVSKQYSAMMSCSFEAIVYPSSNFKIQIIIDKKYRYFLCSAGHSDTTNYSESFH